MKTSDKQKSHICSVPFCFSYAMLEVREASQL